jgi:lysophospholipid acyltransferase (LPLAT)-like uncharacterized protein
VKPHKRLLRSPVVRAALCAITALYVRVVHATGRWRVERGDIPEARWRTGAPFIIAFWHGRLMMMPYCWRRGVPANMLVSQHADGQLIAHTIRHFGFASIAGSTRRGGVAALRAILRGLERGESLGITPDGPRGPRMRASIGVVDIARASGVPMVPLAFSTSRRRVLGTWDRFVVALPLSRGVFVWGSPIEVPRDADAAAREAARRTLEDGLNAVTREADRLVGQTAIDPAPLEAVVAETGAPRTR